MKNKSKISGTAAKLMTQVIEVGLIACCTSKNHLNVILFCHRHGLESPLSNHCANIPVKTYPQTPLLSLKSRIYDRIAGAPGANAVLEVLNKPVANVAVNSVIYLLDREGVPQAEAVVSHQKNLLEKVPNYPEILTRALNFLELGSNALLESPQASSKRLSQPSSRNLLSRKQHTRSFHRFKLLPAELRLMIWKLAMAGRAVELYQCKGRIKPACPPPSLFRVNRESRQVALKEYNKEASGNALGEVIFSYDLDTLYLSHRSCAFHDYEFIIKEMAKTRRWMGAFERMERVAIHLSTKSQQDRFIQHLSRFRRLEEVTVIMDDEVISFEPHEIELVEHRYNLRERQSLANRIRNKFKLLDVHAETRAPNTPVFNTKLARSYRVG
jgi:hypothetical protein